MDIVFPLVDVIPDRYKGMRRIVLSVFKTRDDIMDESLDAHGNMIPTFPLTLGCSQCHAFVRYIAREDMPTTNVKCECEGDHWLLMYFPAR